MRKSQELYFYYKMTQMIKTGICGQGMLRRGGGQKLSSLK